MAELDSFIDIERFVKWIYDHNEIFANDSRDNRKIENDNSDNKDSGVMFGENTRKKWARFETVPNEDSIELINNKLPKKEEFHCINIAELLLCVNNEKDVAGKKIDLPHITSTGKKIFNILILGRILDQQKKDGCFCVSRKSDKECYNYLSSFNNSSNKIKNYYYLPGRAVSVEQIKKVGEQFKNGIKESALVPGLEELIRCGLVSCVGNNNNLYKLDFEGCQSFLKNNLKDKE